MSPGFFSSETLLDLLQGFVEMSPGEMTLLVIASIITALSVFGHAFTSHSAITVRRSAGEGLIRLALLAAMAWIAYVLYHHADPSVVGIYRLFYLVLGFAVIHTFGLGGARFTGMRHGVDVQERDNRAAGLLIAAYVLATGMIFGGSLWGEADPDGEGEGGWWIPMGFFVSGWIALSIACRLYRSRETGGLVRRMRQTRDPRATLGFALYLLSTGWILTESVAGDFHGWKSGLTAVGSIAAMLIGHEAFGLLFNRDLQAKPKAMTFLEAVLYLGTSVAFTYVNQHLLPKWGLPI